MSLGIYTNIFQVTFEDNVLNLVEDDRSKYLSLKELRKKFPSHIYADRDKVYGYGDKTIALKSIGFVDTKKKAQEIPKTTHIILNRQDIPTFEMDLFELLNHEL